MEIGCCVIRCGHDFPTRLIFSRHSRGQFRKAQANFDFHSWNAVCNSGVGKEDDKTTLVGVVWSSSIGENWVVSTDGVMMHSPFLASNMVTLLDSPMSSKLSEDSTGLKSDE